MPLSDVDIAIFVNDVVDFAETKLEILGRLTDILLTDDVDLVLSNTANLPLVYNVLKNHKLIGDTAK